MGATCTLRCVAVHPTGAEVACGDRGGTVRVYSLPEGRLQALLPAHDAEVLALDYSGGQGDGAGAVLASGGRDRLMHVYDASQQVSAHLSRQATRVGAVSWALGF